MKKTRRKRAFQHNIDAANAVINELRVNQKALAIQSTGTGKSYVMREIIEKFPLKNVMVVGPSWKVLTEVRGILDTRKTNCTIEYATYIGLAKRIVNSLPTGLDAIIIDEVHHLPAPVWGRGVKELENVNSQAKLIGFTGTPKRTDGIDISQSHFNGETTKMDYVEAWEKGILPTPKFINVYFKVDENPINVAKSYLKKKGISDTNRVEAEKAAKVLELEWDRIKETQSKIIKQHLRKTAQKIIVFFDNISDLEKFSGEVESWFRAAGFNPTSISIHSKLLKSIHDHNWEQALLPSKNGELKLIMSVSMLNEGVHIPEVEGVMFLRRTVSSIIYLQQLGRCMKARQKQQPVVFDFVGNIESAGEDISTTFNKTITIKTGKRNKHRSSFKLKVYEYGKNIIDILSKIKKLTFGNNIPEKLLKAHETGDFSEIKPGTSEYNWLIYQKSSNNHQYYTIACALWNEFYDWKRKIFPPRLQQAHETGDFSEIKGSTSEYVWMITNRKNKNSSYFSIANTLWKEYIDWRLKNNKRVRYNNSVIHPKLQEALETGDYSEIASIRGKEYSWMTLHKKGGTGEHFPIADILWEGYKQWQLNIKKFIRTQGDNQIIHPRLQKAHETGDYSEIHSYSFPEIRWISSHKQGGRNVYLPIADILWDEFKTWRKNNQERLKLKHKKLRGAINGDISCYPLLVEAHKTGDYSQITSKCPEYNWLREHRLGASRKHYPIADTILEEYKNWCLKNRKRLSLWGSQLASINSETVRLLEEAHQTGDYSKIMNSRNAKLWIKNHRLGGKSSHEPIADTFYKEFCEWRVKNSRRPIRNGDIPYKKLQEAYETGDYSKVDKPSCMEYRWMRFHKRNDRWIYYPIADLVWQAYVEWKHRSGGFSRFMGNEDTLPTALYWAHKTGDYSQITLNSKEYIFLKKFKRDSEVHYPIIDVIWNEYQEWRKKNKK